jgi:Ca2+:H+ antiporter
VVKAQLTGAIIGNSLLGLGLAILIGGATRVKQTFKPERASLLGSLLILSVIALLLPALFDYTERGHLNAVDVAALEGKLSMGVAIVLITVYIANLVYTLRTHRDIFATAEEGRTAEWSLGKSLGVMVLATLATAVEAELLSGSLEGASARLGLSPIFIGVIVLAIAGNVTEYFAAIYFARQNRMGLVVGITLGSTIQIALLLAPLLVLLSPLTGHPMNLVFSTPLELIAIAGSAFAANAISRDGETTWFEGLLLLAVYALFALAFLFATR